MNRKVLSFGVFDVLHVGHLNILTNARALGEKLVVAVQDDLSVLNAKGQPPILTLEERMRQLQALPFIDNVISYTSAPDSDAISVCRREVPDIIVQGDDWLYSGDRTEIISLIKEIRARLILLPRTDHISSTEIKRRISNGVRRDDEVLKGLVLLPINKLSLYENYDPRKTDKLVEKISNDGVFFNPVTVGIWHEKNTTIHILVDGANRVEALRRLGAKYIPCMVFDYRQIDLRPNVHYIQADGSVKRASEFLTGEGRRIEFPQIAKEDIVRHIKEGKMIESGATWHTPPCTVIRLRIPLSNLADGSLTPDGFKGLLAENERRGNIRFIPRSVYVCDEWDTSILTRK